MKTSSIIGQSSKNEKLSKALGDTLSMLKLKMEKQKKYFLKFKEDALEQEYSQFFLQQLSLAMRVILVLLIIQQIITRINNDEAYDEKKRIIFLIFCGVALIVIKFLKFGFLQKLNWIVNIFAVLILADCFETDENKSSLRVFFNGMAFILCFWIEGQNIILDGLCLLICFILIHIFRGIDAETALLTIITLPTTLFLKYQHYLKDRQSFLTIELSEFWLDVSQDVSFVQIVAFSFAKLQQKFSFKGSKQSSPQFNNINSDEDLNALLDLLVISTIEVAPKYQMKEFQRSIGKTLKSVLMKLFDDSKWSFYAKDNKKYIGTAILDDFEYKFSIRGLNSEDELFILTLGIKDPESLKKHNEQAILNSNILPISLENYEKRFQKLQADLNQEPRDSMSSLRILQRTMESMNAQTEMLKEVASKKIKPEVDQQNSGRKNQNLKFEGKHEELDFLSFQAKSPQTNTLLNMQDQEKVAFKDPISQSTKNKDNEDGGNALKNQQPDQQQYFISSNNFHSEQKEDKDHILPKSNYYEEEQEPKLSQKIIESENFLEEKEKKNLLDHPIAKSHFAKEVKWGGQIAGEEEGAELEESLSFFSLKQLIDDVSRLYSDDVFVSCNIDSEVMARGRQLKFRSFLIGLFENCLHLKIEDQVNSSLQFSQSKQQENENIFLLEFKSSEKEFYCYQDKDNPAYKNGKSLDQAQSRALRYLNGINLPIVQSLEFSQFMKYLEMISAKPVAFIQDNSTLKLAVQMIISLDPQRSSSMTAADRSGGNNNENRKVQIQLDDEMTPQENQIFSQYIDDDLKNNESAQHTLYYSRNRPALPNKSNFRSVKQIQKTGQSNILSSKSIKVSHLMSPKPPDNTVSHYNNKQEYLIQNLSLHMLSSPQTPENNQTILPSSVKSYSDVVNLPKIGKEELRDWQIDVSEDKIKRMRKNQSDLKEEVKV